jgi:hypothetical protein
MKARCPNDPTHITFETVAHVMQLWMVNEDGEHVETLNDCCQVSFSPDPGNMWTCTECGAEAVVT